MAKEKFAEFLPVIETHNAGDRVFIRSILDAEKIVYFIRGETVAPYLFNSLPMTFMAKADQADKARKIPTRIFHEIFFTKVEKITKSISWSSARSLHRRYNLSATCNGPSVEKISPFGRLRGVQYPG